MVKKPTNPKAKGKGAASSAPPAPPKATPGSAKPKMFKKKAKADPEKQKAAAAEAAATAEASASAPAPMPADVGPSAAGVVAENNGASRKMSKKERMKGKEEERTKEGEKGRTEGKKERIKGEEKKDEERQERSGAGFIFMCSARTKPECFQNSVFGLPKGKIDVVEKIWPGAKLFLYDFDLKLLYGVYKATTRGGMDLVRNAFHGRFPAQVKFKIDKDCLPLPESSFKHAIKENYDSKGKFTQELNSKQVHRLLALYKPISLPQPSSQHVEERHRTHLFEGHMPHYVEERRPSRHEEMQHPRFVEERRLTYDYEERRPPQHVEEIRRPQFVEEIHAPVVVRAPLFEDNYKAIDSLHGPLQSQHTTHLPMFQHAPPTYYHHVAPANDPYHQPQVNVIYERAAGDATNRDPLLARDYRVPPGDIVARSDQVDELYRSYKLATRAVDLHQDPSYVTTAYENPRPAYSESIQGPVSTRVNVPGVPVSSRYSFAGAPAYR